MPLVIFSLLLNVALILVSSRRRYAAEEQPRQIVQLVRQLMTLVILALILVLCAHASTTSQRTPGRAHRPGVQLRRALRSAIDSATTATSARVACAMLTESVVACHVRLAIPLPAVAVVLLV